MLSKFLDMLVSLVSFDYINKRKKDKELLALFLQILPTNSNSVIFLKEHDMGDPMPFSYLQPLNTIRAEWIAPDKEFCVKKLEKMKRHFISKLNIFLSEFAQRSAGIANGFISIGLHDHETRKDMLEYRNKLNALAKEAYDAYEAFVRVACKEI